MVVMKNATEHMEHRETRNRLFVCGEPYLSGTYFMLFAVSYADSSP
jgi:hypothetical protein